jgi:MFS family permease
MISSDRMTRSELRASVSLAGIFGLRMLGMFIILPVFAIYAEQIQGGENLILVGIAIGAYGLTQAILQIPFGWLSDRYGRKPVIYAGLAIFAAGSFIAAFADSIYIVILGRVVQGAGAISAAVMAMSADLTRETQRTKAMALIGSTIGASFALSMVLSPWLSHSIGVPGIFAMTGVLAVMAMGIVYGVVLETASTKRTIVEPIAFKRVLFNLELARLNFGIFSLHAVLMALFVAVPFTLRDAGLPLERHWQVYLPVMLGSFVLMVPALLIAQRRDRAKQIFLGAIGLLLAGQVAGLWASEVMEISLYLLIFFVAFNVLEAMLPSAVSKIAPVHAKGAALGIYSSIQFFGTFAGAAAGGYIYQRFGIVGIIVFDLCLLSLWLLAASGMGTTSMMTRSYRLPALDGERSRSLMRNLQAQPGVREVRLSARKRTAYLKVDPAGFDEKLIFQTIEKEI